MHSFRTGSLQGVRLHLVSLDKESRDNLAWWVENIVSLNGRAMTAVEPDIVIYSDASKKGWGEFKMVLRQEVLGRRMIGIDI